jgi:uncharacterized membrane protein YsdA (DUF1294 family)
MNALGFVLMRSDKEKAIRNKWRIPEKTLLTVAALGGSIGCFCGMRIFHHKTRHPLFSVGLPVMMAVQIVFFSFLSIVF